MSDAGFLRDIVEHPQDDAPRLVYADWLDDHGQSDRAEFIRVQCQLARLPEDDPRRPDLAYCAGVLLRRHGPEWGKPLERFTRRVEFSRGFVGKVTLTAAKFLKVADGLLARTPLRELRLLQLKAKIKQIADCPALARLRALDLHGLAIGAGRTGVLAGSPHLANLTELRLAFNHLGDQGAELLAGSPHLGRLLHLDLSWNDIGDRGALALARSPHLGRLLELHLYCPKRLSPAVAAELRERYGSGATLHS
jgi:uncharacterized protein (TIGR02996 family)